MTTTVDFDALQAAQGPRVVLMPSTFVGPTVTGVDYADFSDFASVYVTAEASVHGGPRPSASLTVTVQHSDDGSSWSTAATLTLTNDGSQSSLVSAPKAHLRAVAVGTHSEWQVLVTAAPTYLDPPASESGGSQPGVEVVRVPISFDTPGFVIAAAGPSGIALCTLDAGDLLVGTAGGTYSLSCLPTTIGFDGTTPTLGFVTTAGRGNMPGTPPDSDKTVLLGSQNADWDAGGILKRVPHDDPLGQVLICATPTTLWGYLFDGLGADPESTMGDGEIVLFVARATT